MDLKCIILFIALITLSASIEAIAVYDSITTGPYSIAFDIGLPHGNYGVNVLKPIIDNTSNTGKRTDYSLIVTNKSNSNRFALISIRTFERELPKMNKSSDLVKALASVDLIDPNVSNFTSQAAIIDNSLGAVAQMRLNLSSENQTYAYDAIYLPSFNLNHSLVQIYSLFPWSQGTVKLLKTIHVEKIN